MAQANSTTTLDGLFKTVYGEKGPIEVIPDVAVLIKMVKFRETERIGRKYDVPVMLSSEQGATYLAAGDGVVTLASSVAATLKNAEVDGAQIILRGQIDYETAAKATNNKTSFKNSTELMVENLMESAAKRLEIAFMYGGTGLATVASSVNTDSTHTVLQVSTATWAIGIWSGMENATLQYYKVSDGTLVSSGTDSVFTITAVDPTNRKLTVSGSTTGISALDTAAGIGNLTAYFNTAKAKECSGLDKIVTNTGTLFNIDASAYSLWQGQSYSANSAALTMAKVLAATSKAVGRGLNTDAVLLCNPSTWANLNANEAALRMFDGSYSSTEGKNGFQAITYFGQNGKIEVISHSVCKEGEAFLFAPKKLKRVGAQDLSFSLPGRIGEIFLNIPDQNCYEMRVYGNQSIFSEAPAQMVKITNIVNT